MSTDVVSVRDDATVAEAVEAIRNQCAEDESQLYQIYAVDSAGTLRGIVPVARLIVSWSWSNASLSVVSRVRIAGLPGSTLSTVTLWFVYVTGVVLPQ